MDPKKNRIPQNVERIHLIAVCGTAMGALASMLKDLGFEVTGSDQNVYPPMSEFLRDRGIEIIEGFDAENLSREPDLVVVGNTVSKDNPEVVQMLKMGVDFCSMPQAVNRFLVRGRKPLVVTGTHGKTTTSSILAWVLETAGYDPGFMIGGILKNFDSNYRIGKGRYVVLEGDEYDTAFFDKGPKFLHYDPFAAILTGVEFDHADIFTDFDHVKQVFDGFVSKIATQHTLFACAESDTVTSLVHGKPCSVVQYGRNTTSDWRLGQIEVEAPWTRFEVVHRGRVLQKIRTRLLGEHNLLNALAAIAVADHLGISLQTVGRAFETFEGIKRRQEVRGRENNITVMDDFAHHPTEVRETIRAVKPFNPEGRLVAVFEPRTNSSMRKVFQDVYPLCFDEADLICIRNPSRIEKIPVAERFSSTRLAYDLKQRGKEAHFFADTESIIDFLIQNVRSGDLVLVMSNGGFDNIHERLLKRLAVVSNPQGEAK